MPKYRIYPKSGQPYEVDAERVTLVLPEREVCTSGRVSHKNWYTRLERVQGWLRKNVGLWADPYGLSVKAKADGIYSQTTSMVDVECCLGVHLDRLKKRLRYQTIIIDIGSAGGARLNPQKDQNTRKAIH